MTLNIRERFETIEPLRGAVRRHRSDPGNLPMALEAAAYRARKYAQHALVLPIQVARGRIYTVTKIDRPEVLVPSDMAIVLCYVVTSNGAAHYATLTREDEQ